MEKMMHLASQYLAAAGISFLDKKEDDSHTNLGFSIDKSIMFTRSLDDSGTLLTLNYELFALQWVNKNETITFHLDGKTHREILKWIEKMCHRSNFSKPYVYEFHYELPYTISDDFKFELNDEARLDELLEYRKLTQIILKDILAKNRLESEIRVWPHHFDTGAFTYLPKNSEIGIGLGLAIPDETQNGFYFYISGYRGHNSISTSGFPNLTLGKWLDNKNFKGAVLSANGIKRPEGLLFFNEALLAYKSLKS